MEVKIETKIEMHICRINQKDDVRYYITGLIGYSSYKLFYMNKNDFMQLLEDLKTKKHMDKTYYFNKPVNDSIETNIFFLPCGEKDQVIIKYIDKGQLISGKNYTVKMILDKYDLIKLIEDFDFDYDYEAILKKNLR